MAGAEGGIDVEASLLGVPSYTSGQPAGRLAACIRAGGHLAAKPAGRSGLPGGRELPPLPAVARAGCRAAAAWRQL